MRVYEIGERSEGRKTQAQNRQKKHGQRALINSYELRLFADDAKLVMQLLEDFSGNDGNVG